MRPAVVLAPAVRTCVMMATDQCDMLSQRCAPGPFVCSVYRIILFDSPMMTFKLEEPECTLCAAGDGRRCHLAIDRGPRAALLALAAFLDSAK
jgi:hypothetical protein